MRELEHRALKQDQTKIHEKNGEILMKLSGTTALNHDQ